MNRYCSSLKHLLPAVAVLLCATPGYAAHLTQYYVPKTAAVALRFSAVDPARAPVDEHWLLQELTTAFQARSGMPLKRDGEATAELSGLRTSLNTGGSQIVFEYVHLARNRAGDEWGETLTIPVFFRVEEKTDVIVIHLQPAEMADLMTRKTPGLFLPTPKLRPIAELFDDFSAILNDASSVEVRHTFLLKGEEESNASPATCIEKFDRLLGRYGYAKDEQRLFDPKRDDVFLYRTAQDSIQLKVAAVHYRDGSRVFYEAWIPFQLRADGAVKGYALGSALTSEVRRVLEDPPTREAEGGVEGLRDRVGSRN